MIAFNKWSLHHMFTRHFTQCALEDNINILFSVQLSDSSFHGNHIQNLIQAEINQKFG